MAYIVMAYVVMALCSYGVEAKNTDTLLSPFPQATSSVSESPSMSAANTKCALPIDPSTSRVRHRLALTAPRFSNLQSYGPI